MEREHILKHWNEFREAMLCPHVSKVETARLREAFFAGAVAVFQIMAFDIAKLSDAQHDKVMDELYAECKRHIEEYEHEDGELGHERASG